MSDVIPIIDRLRASGIDPSLKDASPDTRREALSGWAAGLNGDLLDVQTQRNELVRGLGLSAREVDAALEMSRGSRDSGVDRRPETFGDGIVDLVWEGERLAWLIRGEGGPRVVPDVSGHEMWPASKLPWKTVPHVEPVRDAFGQPAPFHDVADEIRARVVLPDPAEEWSHLLAAWGLGTYLLDRFTYFPELMLEGPPARGKTRLGKALVYLSYRGYASPSLTPATLFRDRAWHRTSLLLDIEDLPRTLERSDVGDLLLASFERDGVVRRVARVDAAPQDQVEAYPAYGGTIIATNKPIRPTSPLASRCIELRLPEAGGVVVPDAMTPADALMLRARLVAWAAGVDRVPNADVSAFTGRFRDLAQPLLRVLTLVAPDTLDGVTRLLAKLDAGRRNDSATSWEARVAVAMWEARGQVSEGRLFLSDLLPIVNRDASDEEQMSAQRIGYVRKHLGLEGGRGGPMRTAFIRWPGEDVARALYERYAETPTPSLPGNPPDPPDCPATPVVAGDPGRDTSRDTSNCPANPPAPETRVVKGSRDTRDTRDTSRDPREDHSGPASNRQRERLVGLAREVSPNMAAHIEARIAAGVSEDEAYALIGQLGGMLEVRQ